ncbi:MAG: CBS domain-containing protein [Desulfuromonadales bacterium]|jgi:CBS domain-containing protein|nr:CBS domain-containing protein [Desulfuromonadales bacterium]
MKTVKEVLEAKGGQVLTVTAGGTVYEALELMAANNVGALVVVEGDKMVGIVSERDYARKVILRGASSLKLRVRSIMSKEVCCANSQMTVDECMALITEMRCRHLPVIDDDDLVGLVSIGDLVKATLEEKELLISQLKTYITSG